MLKNEPGLTIVAVHTAENESLKAGVIYSVYSVTSLVRGHAADELMRESGTFESDL